jgi:hypothetical protein
MTWLLFLVLAASLASCYQIARSGGGGGSDDDDSGTADDDDTGADDDDASGDDDDASSADDDDTTSSGDCTEFGPSNTWWHACQEDVPNGLGSGHSTGDTHPNFSMQDQYGDQVELHQFFGKVIVLDLFWYG